MIKTIWYDKTITKTRFADIEELIQFIDISAKPEDLDAVIIGDNEEIVLDGYGGLLEFFEGDV